MKYSLPWGSIQKDSILISATVNGAVSQFKLYLNVTSADSSLPKLRLIAPATMPFKTNDTKVTCKLIASDSGAGIGSVTFTKDGTVITDTTRFDTLYQCNIDNLVHGVPITLKMVATDASMRKNRDSISITITRDSTMEDKNPPTFSVVSDPRQNGRSTIDTGTIKVLIEDRSGIADNGVIVKLNGTTITGITKNGTVYAIPFVLPRYGQNSIIIKATDNSTAKNSDSITIVFDYNTKSSEITLVSPADNAQDIDTFPSFKWTGGSDTDGDSVFFNVLYGTSGTSLSSQSLEYTKVNEIKLTNKLAINTIYYWKVIGYTKGIHKDTVSSGVYSYKTANPDRNNPVITLISPASYTAGMRVTTAINNISFTAIDANGIDSAYYTVDGTGTKTMITGINGTYTFSYTLTRHGLDTITVSVVDGSAQHNKTSSQLIVNYNTPLPATITLGSPANNATEIAVLAPFSWVTVNDLDGDSVYYVVEISNAESFVN